MFSEYQLRMTYNFISQADELHLQTILTGLRTEQLRKLLKTIERSIRKRDPMSDCLCQNCHMHAVNMEDGIEVCDSCLAE